VNSRTQFEDQVVSHNSLIAIVKLRCHVRENHNHNYKYKNYSYIKKKNWKITIHPVRKLL
jgi:hypothetical protein